MPTVLITGATRGIGNTLAQDLGRDHHIIVGGRRPESIEEVVAGLPAAAGFLADLRDPGSVESASRGIAELDVVIHCAGIVPPRGMETRAAWRETFEVNVFAVVQLTEALLPALRASRGLVVFVNSGAGLRAMGTDGYSASKFALTSYADSLREQERGQVRVASVHPGRVDTDMQRDLQERMGRPYLAEEHLTAASVAAVVRAVVSAGDGAVIESVSVRPA